MVLIMAVVSLVLFTLFETDKLAVAGKVLGPYSSTDQREIWLEKNGYNEPLIFRYVDWAGNAIHGDFGQSIQLRVPVADVLWPRLANTAILAAVVFAVMIPLSLTLGVLAGLKEGSFQDRSISIISVVTTSVPECINYAFHSDCAAFELVVIGCRRGRSLLCLQRFWKVAFGCIPVWGHLCD